MRLAAQFDPILFDILEVILITAHGTVIPGIGEDLDTAGMIVPGSGGKIGAAILDITCVQDHVLWIQPLFRQRFDAVDHIPPRRLNVGEIVVRDIDAVTHIPNGHVEKLIMKCQAGRRDHFLFGHKGREEAHDPGCQPGFLLQLVHHPIAEGIDLQINLQLIPTPFIFLLGHRRIRLIPGLDPTFFIKWEPENFNIIMRGD